VVLNGVSPDSAKMISRVPQGSVLGPLLFIIYINDLSYDFSKNVTPKLFADDAKLYTVVKTQGDVDDLQESINKLSNWATNWQLKIAFDKCNVIDFATKAASGSNFTNNIDGKLLPRVAEVKDLGVIFDPRLKFSAHVAQVVLKAKQRLFLLFRAFKIRDKEVLLKAYKSYIIPLVTYCSSVWSPGLLTDIKEIESVQRLFTRRVAGLEKIDYKTRLQLLNLPSLELRRLRADLLLCYKIFNGHVAGGPEAFGLSLMNRSTRGHCLKLKTEHCRVDARKFFFNARLTKPWNSLPNSVINADSVRSFKIGLTQCNFSKFLMLGYD
jgi:hypothetical protein